MNVPAHLIPDRDPPAFYPLRSYLRVPCSNVAAEYIEALSAPGDLVVDPFACTPTIARAAQRMGRRAIAVESNPLWSWVAHAMATVPPAAQVDAALARLGDALKDDVPLRNHIHSLYGTVCAACRSVTPADYFIHTRDVGPVQRCYHCVHCGEKRVEAATEDDLKHAASFDAHGFHYHFAFDRVVPEESPHAERIRKILDLYTPRNLYALVTLTVKIDALFREAPERDILLLLLLHLLDRGTSFYAAPDAAAQVAAHKQFVEFNLWHEIENAAHALGEHVPEPVQDLADSTAEVVGAAGSKVFLGRGSAKALGRALPEQSAALVLTTPPVRRLGVWALSYFWGAWVLGRAATESLIPSLDSHRNDPQWERRWYFETVVASIQALAGVLAQDGHLVMAFDESSHEIVEAQLLAASGARLELETFIFQPRSGDVPRREFDAIRGALRVVWQRRRTVPLKLLSEAQLAEKIRAAALAAGREVLSRRAEPLAYSWLHYAAYSRAAREGYLTQAMTANTKVPPNRFVYNAVHDGISEGYAHDLDHYQGPEEFLWLGSPSHADVPLVDRVEDAVCEILQTSGPISREELQDKVYRHFPQDLTPEAGLVELCARAYADERQGQWQTRTPDADAEKSRALDLVLQLGERLQYRVRSGAAPFDLIWERDGEIADAFVWRTRARFDDLMQLEVSPARGYLLIPEAQVELARERVRRLPLQAEAFQGAGWNFVRAPFVEQLLREEKIERHAVLLITGLVPALAGEKTQLELF